MLFVGGESFSKKVTRATEQQRADVQVKRRWWDILVSRQSIGDLVFLDETGANTKMIRRYGWGPKSSRVISDVPHGHWKTTTFVAGLRASGFIAPLVVDGPIILELSGKGTIEETMARVVQGRNFLCGVSRKIALS